jgi:hypothetical protein
MYAKQLVLFLAIALLPIPAMATPITYSFTSGGYGASVEFAQSGSDLIVTLTNTGTADALVPTDILTAVYFDVAGSPSLSRNSAVVPLTSDVFEIGSGSLHTPGDRVVGGEWAYILPPGISSTGLGIFGPGQLFPGPNLQGPPTPDGIQFGISPAGDDVTTGNGGLTGEWLIKNSVVFTLGGYTGNPSADISGVVVQYGTALDEPQYVTTPFIPAPEPSSVALLALGMLGASAVIRRRRRA